MRKDDRNQREQIEAEHRVYGHQHRAGNGLLAAVRPPGSEYQGKPGGTFMIVNESDGRNTKDEKWAGIIDGMRIFTQERLTQYLKDAGFSQIAAHVNRKQHWICLLAEKAR